MIGWAAEGREPSKDREVERVFRRRWCAAGVGALALACGLVANASGAAPGADRLATVNHIVVIYQENHSFDNLYGGWEAVRGRSQADPAHTRQVNQTGTPYNCLRQLDVNLTSPPL